MAILKMYLCTKNELYRSRLSKVNEWTDRQTHRQMPPNALRITTPHSRVLASIIINSDQNDLYFVSLHWNYVTTTKVISVLIETLNQILCPASDLNQDITTGIGQSRCPVIGR